MTEYHAVVRRLSAASVRKKHDAFSDVPWPEGKGGLDPYDARFALAPDHPLAASEWYRALPPRQQAHLGLHLVTQTLRYGISFECVLGQGLLELARTCPNDSPEFRYALHEVAEEAQHSMMFQEFIDRAGTDPPTFSGIDAWVDRRVPQLGRVFPEVLLAVAWAGEIFIDRDNRRALTHDELHPVLRQVLRIHVIEEARHLCFAEAFLRERLPRLGAVRRELLAFVVPLSLQDSARKLLVPAPHVIQRFGIPRDAMTHAYGPGSAHQRWVSRTAAPIRALMAEHGLFAPRHRRAWRRRELLAADDMEGPAPRLDVQ